MASARPLSPGHPTERLIGRSPAMCVLREQIRHLATFDTVGNPEAPTVLLVGETGTGKGLIAQVLHESGPRAHGPFIEIHCAAIPETLLEAELFGFEAGTFTDAKRAKPGLFEAGSGGILFLDEISAMPLSLQSKLLTALESKRVRRLGAVAERHADVKLIAATQADLTARLATGQFRHDLYHRLAVVILQAPPLRSRGEDVLLLAQYFLRRYAESHGLVPKRLSRAAQAWLRGYDWPGNVRELSHLMERVTLLSPEAVLTSDALEQQCLPRLQPWMPAAAVHAPDPSVPMGEGARIAQTLRETGGNVARTARLLGLSRAALRRRMQRYGVGRPQSFVLQTDAAPTPNPLLGRARGTGGRSLAAGQGQGCGPSVLQGKDQGKEWAGSAEEPFSSVDATVTASGRVPAWEQKPVALLAISLFFPEGADAKAAGYEPWTATVRWNQVIMEKVQGFGGTMLQGGPSLCIAAFGLPRTVDQMPQRAVQVALAIRQLVAEEGVSSSGKLLPQVRLAVHVGEVLVDVQSGPPTEAPLAMGDALTLPVHLLGHAAPGEILLSTQAAHLVEGSCELQVQEVLLRGEQSDHSTAYRVVGLGQRRSPLRRFSTRVQSRFVGRERELMVLHDLLAQVEHGRGCVVGLVGEPGVGKSRLCYELTRSLQARGWSLIETAAVSYGKTTAYLPIIDLLKTYFHIDDRDEGQQVRDKVTDQLLRLDAVLRPTLPALLALLDVSVDDPPWQALDPAQRRQQTLEAIKRLLVRESQVQILLLILEDLQWIDGETQALLDTLLESLPTAHLLLVLSYRPEFQHPWGNRDCYTHMRLDPLSPEHAGELLAALLGDDAGLETLRRDLLARTEGNPFFLEESVQALVESGILVGERGAYRLAPQVGAAYRGRPEVGNHRGLPLPMDLQVPATVQTLLAARIDRLPPAEKHLLQEASVIGKDVPLPVLRAIAGRSETDLHQGLTHLQAAEFLYEIRLFPEPAYTFKHILTHDVAYGSLSPARRRALHTRVVEAIETLYPNRLADQAERLAHHALHGEVWDKAIRYSRQGGVKAASRSAHREAVVYFEQALGALQHLPESRETREQAIDLQLDLRTSLRLLGEYSRLLDCLREAVRLAEGLDDPARLGQVSTDLMYYFLVMGDPDRAMTSGQRALALATALGDVALQVRANERFGRAYMRLGEYGQAIDVLKRMVTSPEGRRLWEQGVEESFPFLFCRSWLVRCLAERGEFAEGLAYGNEGLRKAEAVDQPFALIHICQSLGILHLRKGDLQQAVSVLERSLELCRVAHIPSFLPASASHLGYAYVQAGRLAEGLPLLEEAVEATTSMGQVTPLTLNLARLSEGCVLTGDSEKALELAIRALALSRESKEQGCQAWVLRLLGEIHAQGDRPNVEAAEVYYRQALTLADEHGMRPLVAHCRLGLGTLDAKLGRWEQAHIELTTAIELYQSMGMAFWLSRAKAELITAPDQGGERRRLGCP